MKKLIYILMLSVIVLAGCKKFEEFEKDPNKPTQAPPSLTLYPGRNTPSRFK